MNDRNELNKIGQAYQKVNTPPPKPEPKPAPKPQPSGQPSGQPSK